MEIYILMHRKKRNFTYTKPRNIPLLKDVLDNVLSESKYDKIIETYKIVCILRSLHLFIEAK